MLRSPTAVLTPPGLAKFPWMVLVAKSVSIGSRSPNEARPSSKVFSKPRISR